MLCEIEALPVLCIIEALPVLCIIEALFVSRVVLISVVVRALGQISGDSMSSNKRAKRGGPWIKTLHGFRKSNLV